MKLSWYGDRTVKSAAAGESFSTRDALTAQVHPQVGAIAAIRRARWSFRRRMELALSLLADQRLDVLINSEGRFEDLPQTLQQLSDSPGDVIMHRVKYD